MIPWADENAGSVDGDNDGEDEGKTEGEYVGHLVGSDDGKLVGDILHWFADEVSVNELKKVHNADGKTPTKLF